MTSLPPANSWDLCLSTLHKIKADKQPVHFDDVEVAKARRGSKMEVVIKSSTTIGKSPKKYEETVFAEEIDTTGL